MKSFLAIVSLLFCGYFAIAFGQPEAELSDEVGAIFTRLADWFTENEIVYDSEVAIGYPSGILASSDIIVDKTKQKVVSIPDKLVISEKTALDSSLAPIFNSNPELFRGNVKLAVWLLHERLDENSFWTPYLDSLPELTSPMFWPQEKKDLLKGSWVLDRVEHDRREIGQTYQDVFVDFLFKEHPREFTPDLYPLEDFVWAFGTIFQRNLWIDGLGVVIVPMLDFFNHLNEMKSAIVYENGHVVLYLKESVKEGTEIFANKGDRPNNDLLRLFGFIIRNNNANIAFINDQLEEETVVKQQLKEALLQKYNALPDLYPYGDSPQGLWVKKNIPNHVVTFYRVKFWEPTDSQVADFVERGTLPSIDPTKMITEANERKVIKGIVNKLEDMINRYPDSYKVDKELLSKPDLEPVDRLAIQVRFEEKRILNEARSQLMQQTSPAEGTIV